MSVGSDIDVRVFKADGTLYRSWRSTVEELDTQKIVVVTPIGRRVVGPGGGWTTRWDGREFYWFERPYNLIEVYEPGGRLRELYSHIASPARLEDGSITYVDHELDVVLKPGKMPVLEDEDDFAEAADRFGYSSAFRNACYEAAKVAMSLLSCWQPRGNPFAQPDVRTSTPATDSRTRSTDV